MQFAIEIPASFERDVRRGDRPAILVIADATDPGGDGDGDLRCARRDRYRAQARAARARRGRRPATPAPFEITLQRRYNPEGITQYNIVPGLLGVVLTMTMMMFTALAVTREIERGTMESLLVHADQAGRDHDRQDRALRAGRLRADDDHPGRGALSCSACRSSAASALLVALSTLFAASNLAVGYTFSTVAQNQLQAVQMTFFFFLPNFLLSGFTFPFRGMPEWAQAIGEVLPLTHFMRIVRGITLKGNGFADMQIDVAGAVHLHVRGHGARAAPLPQDARLAREFGELVATPPA